MMSLAPHVNASRRAHGRAAPDAHRAPSAPRAALASSQPPARRSDVAARAVQPEAAGRRYTEGDYTYVPADEDAEEEVEFEYVTGDGVEGEDAYVDEEGFLYEVDENSVEPGAEEDAYDEDDETVPVPNAPPGMALYETLLIIHPTIPDMVRDQQLARYESFLVSLDCQDVQCSIKGKFRMAYPIRDEWEGLYVLFHFHADSSVPSKCQKLLSTPDAGNEGVVLRHATFRY